MIKLGLCFSNFGHVLWFHRLRIPLRIDFKLAPTRTQPIKSLYLKPAWFTLFIRSSFSRYWISTFSLKSTFRNLLGCWSITLHYLWAIDFSIFLCNISNRWPGSMQHSFIILLKLFVSFLRSFRFSWIFEYFCSRRPLARIAPSWVRDCSNLPKNGLKWLWLAWSLSQSD